MIVRTAILRTALLGASVAALSACGGSESDTGPEAISIVGSSTVYPFAQKVAQNFVAANEGTALPVIESTGTTEGIAKFCAGEGPASPDIANASRRMTVEELNECAANGVSEVVEIKIGRDGVVFTSSTDEGIEIELTRGMVYQALAAMPFGEGQSAMSWSDVDGALPEEPILVYGPPSSSGTRDALLDLVLKPACKSNDAMTALEDSDPAAFERNCHALRSDEVYLSQGEQDDVVVRKVANNPRAIGIFGYSYLEENVDTIKGLSLDGVMPTPETIADGSYPASRGLYIYVKKAHVGATPGLAEFLTQWAQDWGSGGGLSEIGLIPMTEEQQSQYASAVDNMPVLTADMLEAPEV